MNALTSNVGYCLSEAAALALSKLDLQHLANIWSCFKVDRKHEDFDVQLLRSLAAMKLLKGKGKSRWGVQGRRGILIVQCFLGHI